MYRFWTELAQPFTILYLITLLAILNLWRRRRETRCALLLVTIPFVAYKAVRTPIIAYLLLNTLEGQYPRLEERPTDAEAIVVLGGSLLPADSSPVRARLGEDSDERCVYAAKLYRAGPACPVLVSGGKLDPESPGAACAPVMRRELLALGVRESDVISEDRSRTTFENAVESKKLLEERQIRKVILVTDAVDMVRAVRCFRKQGFDVIPAPCHYRADLSGSALDFVPGNGAARNCERVWHEWLGVAWYWLHGRI